MFLSMTMRNEGHTLDDFFISSSLNALSTEIEASGQFMMVKKAKSVEEIIQFASMWNMDGLVVIGFCSQDYTYLRNHMRIPFAVYDGYCARPERILNITIDNFSGGYQVGAHFRELGHKKALCISDNAIYGDMERFQGFCAGFAPGTAELLVIPMQKEQRQAFYQRHLGRFGEVSAVFAVSDYYAIDLMRFLMEQGSSVPEELSVAGFDDTPMCEMVYPALTTVRQVSALRAKLAVEKLRELRKGKSICTEIRLPVSLVVRDSTGRRKR